MVLQELKVPQWIRIAALISIKIELAIYILTNMANGSIHDYFLMLLLSQFCIKKLNEPKYVNLLSYKLISNRIFLFTK